MTATTRLVACAVTAALLVGCAAGPQYVRPVPDVPAQWSTALPATAAAADLSQWWRQLDDPVLTALIERALGANRDVREAIARIREARALQRIADAGVLPRINASGSGARDRMSETGRIPLIGVPNPVDLYQAGFDASWELDVFGGVRRTREAAVAEVERVELDREAIAVSVSAEVATSYLRMRGAQSRLAALDDQLAVARETIVLVAARVNSGLVSELDLLRARELLANLEARHPHIGTIVEVEARRIGVLVGAQAGSLVNALAPRQTLPGAVPRLPATVPADLLARRADLRAIERALAAENARVGVAEADKYPRLALRLSLGLLSIATGNLGSSASAFWNAGAGFSAPVYQGGALEGKAAAARARYDQAAIRYEHAVAKAVEEVEAAAIRYTRQRQRRERLDAALRLDEDARTLALARYQAGLADFISVLDAQRQLFSAQDDEIVSREQALGHLVALYKALGGGWVVKSDDLAATSAAGDRSSHE